MQALLTTLPEARVLVNDVVNRASSSASSEQQKSCIQQAGLLLAKEVTQPDMTFIQCENLVQAASSVSSASCSSFFPGPTLAGIEKDRLDSGSHAFSRPTK